MKTTVRLLAVFMILLFPFVLFAQSSATLEGTITDTNGEALAGANIFLVESSQGTAAGEDGSYSIENIDPGTYTIRVTFVGYQEIEGEISFSAGQTVTRNFTMQQTAVMGEGVTVTVGSRAGHTAADELAVPVDVYTTLDLEKVGSSEVGQMLEQVAPSVNFPQQTVADGMDALRSFTLRGLSPDHTLVLINGTRTYQWKTTPQVGAG